FALRDFIERFGLQERFLETRFDFRLPRAVHGQTSRDYLCFKDSAVASDKQGQICLSGSGCVFSPPTHPPESWLATGKVGYHPTSARKNSWQGSTEAIGCILLGKSGAKNGNPGYNTRH